MINEKRYPNCLDSLQAAVDKSHEKVSTALDKMIAECRDHLGEEESGEIWNGEPRRYNRDGLTSPKKDSSPPTHMPMVWVGQRNQPTNQPRGLDANTR